MANTSKAIRRPSSATRARRPASRTPTRPPATPSSRPTGGRDRVDVRSQGASGRPSSSAATLSEQMLRNYKQNELNRDRIVAETEHKLRTGTTELPEAVRSQFDRRQILLELEQSILQKR